VGFLDRKSSPVPTEDFMYIAEAMISAVQSENGTMTLEDLKNYTVAFRDISQIYLAISESDRLVHAMGTQIHGLFTREEILVCPQNLISAVQSENGTMTLEDLKNYTVAFRDISQIDYRGYKPRGYPPTDVG
jgi:gamma-glutamyltranspeptidase